jgi:hypothetical protein
MLLQCHAAPRLQMECLKLIDAHKVQQVLNQQPWLAGRCKTTTPRVSYANTHCEYISVTQKNTCEFLQIGEPILHRERPHIKSCSFLTNNFKNLKTIGVPRLDQIYDTKRLSQQLFVGKSL